MKSIEMYSFANNLKEKLKEGWFFISAPDFYIEENNLYEFEGFEEILILDDYLVNDYIVVKKTPKLYDFLNNIYEFDNDMKKHWPVMFAVEIIDPLPRSLWTPFCIKGSSTQGGFELAIDKTVNRFTDWAFNIYPKDTFDLKNDKNNNNSKNNNQNKSNSKRNPLTKSIRHEVFKRDNYRCVECGATNKDTQLEIDHIIPVSQGGTDELDNLQTLCFTCNRAKTNRAWIGGK
jgi:5-methylcytosine-specific restriction protein A